MDERNLVSLLHLMEHGFNGDRLDLLDDVLAEDLQVHGPVPVELGREGTEVRVGGDPGGLP